MKLLTLHNVSVSYEGSEALHGVDLQIPAGDITAFIGPSGCGKSTLLKTLNRMNDLVEDCRIEGKVLLDGADISPMATPVCCAAGWEWSFKSPTLSP